MNLERLLLIEEERSKVTNRGLLSIDTEGIIRFAKSLYDSQSVKWNCRQIRNAFVTASALAHFDKYAEESQQPSNGDARTNFDIRADHFKVVANAATSFEHYLHETKGKDDGEIAWLERIRADHLRKPLQEPQEPPREAISEFPPSGYHLDPNRGVPSVYPADSPGPLSDFRRDPRLQSGYSDVPRSTPDAFSQGQLWYYGYSPRRHVRQDSIGGRFDEDPGYVHYRPSPMDHLSTIGSKTPQPLPSFDPYQPPIENCVRNSSWQSNDHHISKADGWVDYAILHGKAKVCMNIKRYTNGTCVRSGAYLLNALMSIRIRMIIGQQNLKLTQTYHLYDDGISSTTCTKLGLLSYNLDHNNKEPQIGLRRSYGGLRGRMRMRPISCTSLRRY